MPELTKEQESRRYSKWLEKTDMVFPSAHGYVTNEEWLEKEKERIGDCEIVEDPEKDRLCLLFNDPPVKKASPGYMF